MRTQSPDLAIDHALVGVQAASHPHVHIRAAEGALQVVDWIETGIQKVARSTQLPDYFDKLQRGSVVSLVSRGEAVEQHRDAAHAGGDDDAGEGREFLAADRGQKFERIAAGGRGEVVSTDVQYLRRISKLW